MVTVRVCSTVVGSTTLLGAGRVFRMGVALLSVGVAATGGTVTGEATTVSGRLSVVTGGRTAAWTGAGTTAGFCSSDGADTGGNRNHTATATTTVPNMATRCGRHPAFGGAAGTTAP